METEIGRRMFVGSVVAGLPLLASTSRLAAQAGSGSPHQHANATGTSDQVLDHLVRQLAGIHNAMRRQPRGEHMRAFGAQLRMLAVYSRQAGLDAGVKAGVNALVERDGRAQVLYVEVDRERLRAELKAHGAQLDERLLATPITLDYAARSAALDSLLQTGGSLHLERIAATLERVAPAVDQRMATTIRVNQIYYDEEYWKGYCAELWSQYQETQFLAAALCASAALPVIGAAFVPLCVAQQLAATFLAIVYAGNCMNVRY
jgi:hypothetical protein